MPFRIMIRQDTIVLCLTDRLDMTLVGPIWYYVGSVLKKGIKMLRGTRVMTGQEANRYTAVIDTIRGSLH
jgi:hypothetical protein